MSDLEKSIRTIPDFPKKGILFFDITTLLLDPSAYRKALDRMEKFCREKKADKIMGIEARGFIFGGALADRLGVGFIPARKPGKLPADKIRCDYELEYGADAIEIHADAVADGEAVVIIDDLVATGGSLDAACKLTEKAGGKVAGIAVLIDLAFLPWREKVDKYETLSLITFESE